MFSNTILFVSLFLPFVLANTFYLEVKEEEDLPLPHIIILGATGEFKIVERVMIV